MFRFKKETVAQLELGANGKKVRILKQYQSASTKERDDMWMQHPALRSFFDEIDQAEVFLTSWSDAGFSIHRFGRKQNGFVEYRTMF